LTRLGRRSFSFSRRALAVVAIPGTVRTIGESDPPERESLREICFEAQDELLRIGAVLPHSTGRRETRSIDDSIQCRNDWKGSLRERHVSCRR
jgi:hypothetical protein